MDKNELTNDKEIDEVITAIYHGVAKKFKYVEFGNDFLIVANGRNKYNIKVTKK